MLKKCTIILVSTTILLFIISIIGISKLEVENSFINYFDQETEIYKGMKKIDDDLGGTTPLNVIIKFPVQKKKTMEMMNFLSGTKTMMLRTIKQSTGLQEIKWIKF